MDKDMDMDFDPGLLPLDPEALDSTVRTLGLAQRMVPPPTSEESIDRLLVRAGMAFHDFLSHILVDPLRAKFPHNPGPALLAGKYAWTIADLLMVLTMQSPDGPHSHSTQNGKIEHPRHYTEQWLKTIVDVCLGEEEPPWHTTEVFYACVEAHTLSTSMGILLDEPRLSLDPTDPCLCVQPLPDPSVEPDSNRVAVMLIWSAASTLCMAAAVAPDFRFGRQDIR